MQEQKGVVYMKRKALKEVGVDYTAGVLHFAGKEELYVKYLRKYGEDHHLQDAVAAYEKTDYKEVLDQIHALKGLSGTLGFSRMFQSASAVVSDLRKEEYQTIGEQLKQMQLYQKKLIVAIKTI